MEQESKFQWVKNREEFGARLFTFGNGKIYNLFADFPFKLSEEEVEVFREANPYWANFFKDRLEKYEASKESPKESSGGPSKTDI